MDQKAEIISAVIVGVGGYFGIKYLTKDKEEEQPAFMGGGSSGNGSNTDAYVETQPNTVYNVTVASPSVPSDFGSAPAGLVAPTKKEAAVSSGGSSWTYYSTNRQTQSTNKAVGLSKTSARSSDRFASDPSTGAHIDRYAQQSISKGEADKRAANTKKENNYFAAPKPNQSFMPSTPTKKETKATPTPKKRTWWKPSTWGN